jgi:aspartate/methionine/tyrosine aminotransferase
MMADFREWFREKKDLKSTMTYRTQVVEHINSPNNPNTLTMNHNNN